VKYILHWSDEALDSLAEIWMALDADGKRGLNAVVDDIEQLLESSPREQGESRDDDRRVMFARPLVVTFRVVELRKLVRIIYVRPMEGHRNR
jgi:hypothetical protein